MGETRSRRIERKRTSPELWYRETPETSDFNTDTKIVSDTQDSNSDFAKPSPSSSSETRFGNEHRRERYKNALDEGRSMKISSLRQELKDRGISTGAFFDKMDLVEAYANVIADDIETNHSKRHNAGSRKDQSTTSSDPSYRDVTVHIFDPRAFT